jgi:uncharacterized protein (DUF4415 family)
MKPRAPSKTKSAAANRENPVWTAQDMKKAKRFRQLPKAMQKDLQSIKRRGRPRQEAPKKQITFRLQAALVDHLRSRSGYNAQIETMLLKAWEDRRL